MQVSNGPLFSLLLFSGSTNTVSSGVPEDEITFNCSDHDSLRDQKPLFSQINESSNMTDPLPANSYIAKVKLLVS